MANKFCSCCKVEKALEEFYTRKDRPSGVHSACKICMNARSISWAKANPDKVKERVEKRKPKTRARARELYQEKKAKGETWHQKNPEKARARVAEYRAKYPEKVAQWFKENSIEYYREYRAANPDKVRAWGARRRAAKLQRTPHWLSKEDKAQILAYYQWAAALTRATGELYEVDHIIPLQGKEVSGLHHPDNLQVLSRTDNAKKSNRLCLEEINNGN